MNDVVRNSSLIEDFLGYFTTFHDDEILNVYLEHQESSIIFKIYTKQWTNQTDSNGRMVYGKHGIVTIKFTQISDMELCDFGNQNIILKLEFRRHINGVESELYSTLGLNGRIVSQEVSIVSVDEASQP